MKLLMSETFVNPPPVLTSYAEVHHLEDESVVIPLAMTNLLQDNVHKRDDDMEENEELTTSYANLEPSLHNAPLLLLKTQVMPMVLHSRKVRIVLIY